MTIVPNTFQTPNAFIDQAMPYLTNSELRVLLFATRHIMGWQDKIKKRKGAISLTMFEHGYITESGKRYAGCGLGKQAIIAALEGLVKFGFLERAGKATEDGQEWELHDDNIKWGELIARTDATESNRKQRTTKARKTLADKRAGITPQNGGIVTHTGGVSDNTMQGTVGHTSTGIVGHTESKPSSKPSSKPTARGGFPKHLKDWTFEHIGIFQDDNAANLAMLIKAWGDHNIYSSLIQMPKTCATQYVSALQDLERVGVKASDYADLASFTRKISGWKSSLNPTDMALQSGEWRKSRLATPSANPSNPIDLSQWEMQTFDPENI